MSTRKVFTIQTNRKNDILSLTFEDVNGMLQDKTIVLTKRNPKQRIAATYALSIFTKNSLEKSYKSGMFTVVESNDLHTLAQEEELYFDFKEKAGALVVEDAVYKTEQEVLDLLISKNTVAFKKYLGEITDVGKQQIVSVIRANYGDITNSNIQAVEKVLGTTITQPIVEE